MIRSHNSVVIGNKVYRELDHPLCHTLTACIHYKEFNTIYKQVRGSVYNSLGQKGVLNEPK